MCRRCEARFAFFADSIDAAVSLFIFDSVALFRPGTLCFPVAPEPAGVGSLEGESGTTSVLSCFPGTTEPRDSSGFINMCLLTQPADRLHSWSYVYLVKI